VQSCHFDFFEATFVIFGLFSTHLVYFHFIFIFCGLFEEIDFYVDLSDLKMVLEDF